MMTYKPDRSFFATAALLVGIAGSVMIGTIPSGAASLHRHDIAVVKPVHVAHSQPHMKYVAGKDCAEVGQQVAASQGGTLTKATAAVQNGEPVCIVVVLVPGRDGERPRRVEVAVPAK